MLKGVFLMKKIRTLIFSLFISLGTGALSRFIAGNASEKYDMLIKPSLAPPAAVFSIAWALLYVLMGIAAYIIYTSDSPDKGEALKLYAEQLVVNFIWPIIFFRTGLILLAFILALLLWMLVALCTLTFSKIDKRASRIFVPYFVWMTFAVYLTLATYLLNR